ncbi:MAG: hypothetical protein J6N92_07145 [Alloprevotella sp.]|nr:hypothetical protein [Alloprevotella sp.]
MELILIIVAAYGLVMLVGGIIWESKTPEEKKEMEEKWERERIEKELRKIRKRADFDGGGGPAGPLVGSKRWKEMYGK